MVPFPLEKDVETGEGYVIRVGSDDFRASTIEELVDILQVSFPMLLYVCWGNTTNAGRKGYSGQISDAEAREFMGLYYGRNAQW